MKRWDSKPCGCIRTDLPQSGKVIIRCERHRGRPAKKRLVCHLEDGIVVRS